MYGTNEKTNLHPLDIPTWPRTAAEGIIHIVEYSRVGYVLIETFLAFRAPGRNVYLVSSGRRQLFDISLSAWKYILQFIGVDQ
jgi:hypothetical protein